METFISRRLTFSDVDELVHLYHQCFRDSISREFFLWKYFSTFKEDTIVIGLFYEEKLVASGAMLYELVKSGEGYLKTLRCIDLMTHPNFQGKGLSKKVTKQLTEESLRKSVDCIYTMCSKVASKSFLRNGWKYKDDVFYYYRPYLFSVIKGILFKRKFTSFNSESLEFHTLFDQADESYKRYLQWRYANPKYRYHFIKLGASYLVYSIQNNFLVLIDFSDAIQNISTYLDVIVIQHKLKGVLFVSSISQIKNKSFSFFSGYFVNRLKFGPLSSLLDFNIFYTHNSFNFVYAINYDDV